MQRATTADSVGPRTSTRPPGTSLWLDRALEAVPLSPVGMAVAITAVLFATFAGLGYWTGDLEDIRSRGGELWSYREVRLGLLVACVAGYLPAARRYAVRSAIRIRYALQPWLDTDEAEVASFMRLDGRAALRAGLWGLSIVPVSGLVVDRDPGLYLQPGYWGPIVSFAWVVGVWVGWWLGSFVYVTLEFGRRFSRLADQLRPIDLLDLRAVAPFARHGLTAALLWVVLISIIALNVADIAWFAATASLAVVLGVAALSLPVQGVHRRLRDAKQAELLRVDGALRGDASALAGSPLAGTGRAHAVADLLAWRHHVESVREWPFDTNTIVRFAFYLIIPLGSWLGGAFVERLLGAALD